MSVETDNRNVLVIVTAENCGACIKWKNDGGLTNLSKELQILGIVRVVHISKKAMKDPIQVPFPTQLNYVATWFPTFVIVNGKAWNQNFSESKNSDLPIEVFNGVYKDGVVKMADDRKLFDKIVPWVTEQIENNPKFKVHVSTTASVISKNSINDEKKTEDSKKIYVQTCGTIKLNSYARR
jgi:hypothetical protein